MSAMCSSDSLGPSNHSSSSGPPPAHLSVPLASSPPRACSQRAGLSTLPKESPPCLPGQARFPFPWSSCSPSIWTTRLCVSASPSSTLSLPRFPPSSVHTDFSRAVSPLAPQRFHHAPSLQLTQKPLPARGVKMRSSEGQGLHPSWSSSRASFTLPLGMWNGSTSRDPGGRVAHRNPPGAHSGPAA